MSAPTVYLRLEQRIAADERGGLLHRWEYGRALLGAKAGRKQLPHGMAAGLILAAGKAGLTLSEREIRRRVQLAEAYESEAEVGQALADFGSWSALAEAGFPAVEVPAEPTAEDLAAPDAYEQLSLIPGFAATITVGGRKVPLERATVADAVAYREMYRQIHANYEKRLGLIEVAVEAMLDACDGDQHAVNALEAWRLGTEQVPA